MTDTSLRAAERAYRVSGSELDRAAWVRELMRAGAITAGACIKLAAPPVPPGFAAFRLDKAIAKDPQRWYLITFVGWNEGSPADETSFVAPRIHRTRGRVCRGSSIELGCTPEWLIARIVDYRGVTGRNYAAATILGPRYYTHGKPESTVIDNPRDMPRPA